MTPGEATRGRAGRTTALTTHPNTAMWDAALSSALEALGVTPTQERPGWILCSCYG